MDFLMKKLDIREDSWKKTGLKLGIPKIDVDYLELEYKREGGSPTRSLLLNGGARGKTLGDLILALSSRDVGRCDIGSYIQKHWIVPRE